MKQTALITGATGGIGKSIAYKLCNEGYDVVLVARSRDKLERLVDEIQQAYPKRKITAECCDVAKSSEVTALMERLAGTKTRVMLLVNGAGVSGGGVTKDIKDELWERVINTNLNGVFYMTREALRLQLIPQGGRIVNIASTGGKQGVIFGSPYCASKHGVVGFTKALGLELAKNQSGITVNAVCPGFVETEMAERVRDHYSKIWGTPVEETKRRIEERVPIGRYITPDEVAAMVSYIASPHASGVTAQAINVCGGLGNY